MWMNVVGQLQPGFRGKGGGDAETLQFEHPCESVRHRPVVVHDQDRLRGRVGEAAGLGNHRIILMAKDMGVKAAALEIPRMRYTMAYRFFHSLACGRSREPAIGPPCS